ncbi:MAG: IPT/TIG domain-containing protein [Bryobacteraceae bacterium]
MVLRLLCFAIPFLLAADTPSARDAPAPARDAPGSYVIQTFAGSSFTGDGGNATSALLSQPEGLAVDTAGNIYVADAADNRVRKISPAGLIQTIAGNGNAGFSGDGGPGAAAQLNHPYGIAIDRGGNLFIADLGNSRVRKLDSQGQITTAAGGGSITPGGSGDGGLAINARLSAPRNVAVDLNGNLYISDFAVHRVLRVSAQGILTTVAGSGKAGSTGDGDSPALSLLSSPAGLATDATGTLYIADSGNNRIRKVLRDTISTVYTVTAPTGIAMSSAGTLYVAAAGYFGTTVRSLGAGVSAKDVAVDSAGNVFVTSGQFVRKLASDGQLTTVAGTGASFSYGGDGGAASTARLNTPSAIIRDDLGNWYISDTGNNRIRKINTAGMITTYAGTGEVGSNGDGTLATLAQLNGPRCLALDSSRNLYVADAGNNLIRKITPGGLIFTVAGQINAPLNDPECIAIDSADSLYIAETGNNRILKAPVGSVPAPLAEALKPSSLAVDRSGNLYIAESSRISKWSSADGFTTLSDGLNNPRGVVVTGDDVVLISESGSNRVRSLSPAGTLVTIAGTGMPGFAGDGGPGTLAQLAAPIGLTVDISGTVWIADSGNNRIRALNPSASGPVTPPVALETIVNAASLAAGPVAPGEIVTIYGAGFDATQTQVLFDGTPATLFYAGDSQINCQVPYGLPPGAASTVSIRIKGAPVASLPVNVVAANPGIFTVSQGKGQIAAANEDGSYNSTANPALRGSVITVYATGDGQNNTEVNLTIGGYAAALLYAGPAPGYPGLMQVNARVPSGFLPPGSQAVVLAIGKAQSQAGVTLAVQ